jgi:preprotein translocase subunit YajC
VAYKFYLSINRQQKKENKKKKNKVSFNRHL